MVIELVRYDDVSCDMNEFFISKGDNRKKKALRYVCLYVSLCPLPNSNTHLNGHDKVSTIFEEILSVESNDTGLIWLSHVYQENKWLVVGR